MKKKNSSRGVSRRSMLSGMGAGLASLAALRGARVETAEAEPGGRGMEPEAFKKKLLECLGGAWPDCGPLDVRVESSEKKDGYTLERLSYLAEPTERLSAFLLLPAGASAAKPAPGICVWHQHNGAYEIGKYEPAGLKGAAMHHTGVALAREGYVVLCPDAAGFGDRNQRGNLKGRNLEHYLFAMYVVAGKCLAWKNILDMRRAVDVLAARPEVNPERLGCYGHSMGSTHTWQVGPWEPRLKALVGNCCLPTYEAMERTNLIHCFPNYVPGLRTFGDTSDIAALIAPRALHLNLGETDSGTPIEEGRKSIAVIEKAYAAQKAGERFTHFIEKGAGHVLSEEMWRLTKGHFEKWLRG